MEQGKTISTIIGAYIVIKGLINLILGFSVGNLITLIAGVAFAYTLVQGIKYFNYITGAYLAILFLANIIPNISGHHWFYLIEGIIDAICAFVLIAGPSVKEHFNKN